MYRSVIIFHILFSLIIGLTISSCKQRANENIDQKGIEKNKKFTLSPIPEEISSPTDRANYLAEHYWDNFNFTDSSYVKTPELLHRIVYDYIEVLLLADKDQAIASVQKSLKKAESQPNEKMYLTFVEVYKKFLYDPNSPIRNDEFYIPVVEYIIGDSKSSSVDKERAKFDRELLAKNRIGEKATDFSFTLNSGKAETLYQIDKGYIILYFYNPDCNACAQTIGEMKESNVINVLQKNNSLAVLAFYPDADLNIWKKHMQEIPSWWINGYDKKQLVKNNLLYDLKAIPSIYLLNRDKKVILKDADLRTIEIWLTKNNPMLFD